MDPLDLITDPKLQAQVLFWLMAVSAVLPGLQWIADHTANTWDNALVARLSWLLSRVPRLKMGLGNTEKASATVARTSKAPPPIGSLLVLPLLFLLLGCSDMQLPQSQDALDAKHSMDNVADRLDRRLQVVRSAFAIARYSLDRVCGPDSVSDDCTHARTVATVVDGYISTAVDALDDYRETSQRFDEANSAIAAAERRIGELSTLVNDLVKRFV